MKHNALTPAYGHTTIYDAVVIGAGQAGLAAGYHLKRTGLRFAILDAEDKAGGSWSQYFKSLRLFSPARYSSLPSMPFPGDPHRYPTRDETVHYLQAYAHYFQLPITLNARVMNVTKEDNIFTVATSDNRVFYARSVIAASGSFYRPQLPKIAGLETFHGEMLHSFAYHESTTFTNKRVVVVGAGNSAVQIAAELSNVAQVTLAARRSSNLVKQRFLGQDIHFWWDLFGLDSSRLNSIRGKIFRKLLAGSGPAVLDAGIYRRALAEGKPDQRAMFTQFTQDGVVWADGTREKVDAVIFATGFLPNFSYLNGLGAVDKAGNPLQHNGVSRTVSGLYYIGISYQSTFASATLRGVGSDAESVVSHLAQTIGTRTATETSPPLRQAVAQEAGA